MYLCFSFTFLNICLPLSLEWVDVFGFSFFHHPPLILIAQFTKIIVLAISANASYFLHSFKGSLQRSTFRGWYFKKERSCFFREGFCCKNSRKYNLCSIIRHGGESHISYRKPYPNPFLSRKPQKKTFFNCTLKM